MCIYIYIYIYTYTYIDEDAAAAALDKPSHRDILYMVYF